MNATCTYIKNGKLVTVKIPKNATWWNGPLNVLWRHYNTQGGYDMYQDSWGRAV